MQKACRAGLVNQCRTRQWGAVAVPDRGLSVSDFGLGRVARRHPGFLHGAQRVNLLLDTHVVLWWLDDPELLDRQARGAIADNRTNVYVSAVSIWEIVLKKSIGKLQLPDEDIRDVMEQCRFQTLLSQPGYAFLDPHSPLKGRGIDCPLRALVLSK